MIYISHQKNENTDYVGPFVEGIALKKTLRFLRKVFPYYSSTKHPKNKCMYCHLGLCPGPLLFENPPSDPKGTPASARLREYKKDIKNLILILKGKKNSVLNSLKKEMKRFSEQNKFEEAGKIRDEIRNLQQVMSHTRVISALTPGFGEKKPGVGEMLGKILGLNKKVSKIECYDISNIQGKSATGSMVSAQDGSKPGGYPNWFFDKNSYRKFKIKIENKPNDTAMLKEILERRFAHPEWKYPEIILIDGGIGQLNVGLKIKNQNTKVKNILFISLAKRNKELYIEGKDKPVLLKSLPREIYNLILQLDGEAHRFAINYHKKLRKKYILG